MTSSLTLPALYSRALSTLRPILDDEISTSSPTAQSSLQDAMADILLCTRMINSLGVFSENEDMEDVGDQELVLMSVPWVKAEIEGRASSKGIKERLALLTQSKASYEAYLTLLETYNFPLNESQRSLSTTNIPRDPAGRREAKIKQYRLEKELKDAVTNAIPHISISSSPVSAIIALLPSSNITTTTSSRNSTTVNSDSFLPIRSTTTSLLRLLYTLTQSSISSLTQETSLLKEASQSAQVEEMEEERERKRREQEGEKRDRERMGLREGEMWRLDGPLRSAGQQRVEELLDERGRPNQPFTILPSSGLQNISERARLEAEVYRGSHRLPTMTIDEYLEEERRRGNIITGGGPAQDAQLTESEQLALDAELDGTSFADEKQEKKRQKEETWARYTDQNRKGEGNTMNRG